MVDLWQVIPNAVEQVSALIEQRRYHLHLDIKRALYCACDPARIAQVAANCWRMQCSYRPQGAIALADILDNQANRIVVRVKDNGCGMSPEVLPNVFELFVEGPREIPHVRESGH